MNQSIKEFDKDMETMENDILDDDLENEALETEAQETDLLPLPARREGELDAEEKARLMAETADAVRAEDIEVLDLRDLTIIADFFLICTGKSSIQLRAIADRIEEKLRDAGIRKPRTEGYQEATWILLDYGDVVAHLMAAEQRDFYRLEEFWNAAPRLQLDLMPADARATRPLPSRFDTLTPPESAFLPSGDDEDAEEEEEEPEDAEEEETSDALDRDEADDSRLPI